jgi:DNA invertase Pin-like site-specific DNA recombinase
VKRWLTDDERHLLERLASTARLAWTEPKATRVRTERDDYICALLADGASPTAIARVVGMHRTMIYKIKRFQRRRIEQR